MNKTIIQWFESVADDELRKKLLKAYDPKFMSSHTASDLSDALLIGFNWGDDDDYWNEIYLDMYNNKIETK